MHPLVRGAAAAAVLTALGSFDRGATTVPQTPPGLTGTVGLPQTPVDRLPAPCLPGTLPEGPVCVRIPGENEAAAARFGPGPSGPQRGAPLAERIPRRPERPADPAAYVYPVGAPDRPPRLLGGLDQPGVRLAVRPGEKVVLVDLEHQAGPAEVVFVGDVFGRTVVTLHALEEAGRKRSVLLFHGGLEQVAPGVVQGARLAAGAELGLARTDLTGGLIDVYLEAREVREGARLDAVGADPKRIIDPAVAVPTDVRNVLPLAAREAAPQAVPVP